MKTKIYFMLLIGFALTGNTMAQTKESILAEAVERNVFDKKFRLGISGNQYWGNMAGTDLAKDYFGKPCLGASLRAEYYLLPFVGASAGFGIQQRGAGIINGDVSGGSFTHPWEFPQFNGDSTYRQRLRFNTLEVPVTLLLRTPRDIVKGVRLSAAAGISFVKVTRVNDIFLSVEDGYHLDQVVTNDYFSSDVAYQLSFGTDIDTGGADIFQVHLVYTKGTKNVYAANQGDGRLTTYGFRLSWLF